MSIFEPNVPCPESWVKPYENLESDMIVVPVEGYRVWYCPYQCPFITSLWKQEFKWIPDQKASAECLSHLSCGNNCCAGIYAFKEKEDAISLYIDRIEELVDIVDAFDSQWRGADERIVIGKVKLWGIILDCERGYRGQFAYPSAFYNTAGNSQGLAELYQVPLLALKDYHRSSVATLAGRGTEMY
jgi:hypothetical protein